MKLLHCDNCWSCSRRGTTICYIVYSRHNQWKTENIKMKMYEDIKWRCISTPRSWSHKGYSCFDLLTHSIFTFDAFWGFVWFHFYTLISDILHCTHCEMWDSWYWSNCIQVRPGCSWNTGSTTLNFIVYAISHLMLHYRICDGSNFLVPTLTVLIIKQSMVFGHAGASSIAALILDQG